MKPSTNPDKTRAFTLIELLVVIAIIAVLAGMLLPTLARAKAMGHLARCKSNVKQFGLALNMYVQDHGYYPLFWDLQLNKNSLSYFNMLQPYTASQWTNLLYRCPGYKGYTQDPTEHGYALGSYGYNWFGVGWESSLALGLDGTGSNPPPSSKPKPLPEAAVKVQSDMIAFGDATLMSLSESQLKTYKINGPTAACGLSYITIPPKSWSRWTDDPIARKGIRERHRAVSNIAFCDGHVESIKQEKLWERTDENLRRWNNDHEPHRNLLGP